MAYQPSPVDKKKLQGTGYGRVLFCSLNEREMAFKLGGTISVGKYGLVCAKKIFNFLKHHRALTWGEREEQEEKRATEANSEEIEEADVKRRKTSVA